MSSNDASGSNAASVIAKTAKAAFAVSQLVPSSERIKALYEIRKELENAKSDILEANRKDMQVRTVVQHQQNVADYNVCFRQLKPR